MSNHNNETQKISLKELFELKERFLNEVQGPEKPFDAFLEYVEKTLSPNLEVKGDWITNHNYGSGKSPSSIINSHRLSFKFDILIGMPKPTTTYSAHELLKLGYVGIYKAVK